MKKQYYKLKLADVLLNEGIGEYGLNMDFSGNNDNDVNFDGNSEQGLYFDDYINDFITNDNKINDDEFKQIQLAINIILFTVDKSSEHNTELQSFCKLNNIENEKLLKDIKEDSDSLHKILKDWKKNITSDKKNNLTSVIQALYNEIKKFIPKSIIVKYLFLKFNDKDFKGVITKKASDVNNFEGNNIIKSDIGTDIVNAFYNVLKDKKITSGEMGRIMSQELENDDSDVSFLTNIHQMFSMLLGPGAEAMLKPLFQTVSKVYKEISSNKQLNSEQKQEELQNALKPVEVLKQNVKETQSVPTNQKIQNVVKEIKSEKK